MEVGLAETGQALCEITLPRGSTVQDLRMLVAAEAPMAMPAMRFRRDGQLLRSSDSFLNLDLPDGAGLEAEPVQALVTASADCTAKVWDAAAAEVLATLEGHDDAVYTAAYAPDCNSIVTTSEDCTAKVWSLDGKCLMTLQGHRGAVYDARFSPDGSAIVTASEDCTAMVWVVAFQGYSPVTLRGHREPVCAAMFEEDAHSKRLCVATIDRGGTKKLWDPRTGVCHRTLFGHRHVYSATFSADGKSFVTASGAGRPGVVEVCDVETGKCTKLLTGHNDLVFAASYAPALLFDRPSPKANTT